MNSPKWAIDPLFEQRTAEAQFFYLLVKENFDFLADKYGFKAEFEKIIENSDDTAWLVFQSARGRIRFSWHHSFGMYVDIALGTSSSVDCGAAIKKDWQPIHDVCKFLSINFDGNILRDLADKSLDEQILWWKVFLAPYWKNIIALYDNSPFDKKVKAYIFFWKKNPFSWVKKV